MRDLRLDLHICNNATPGTLYPVIDDNKEFAVIGNKNAGFALCSGPNKAANAVFIAEARTGWPEAIHRALAAEKEASGLRRELQQANHAAEIMQAELERLRAALEEIAKRRLAINERLDEVDMQLIARAALEGGPTDAKND
jgi:hypothetical protein